MSIASPSRALVADIGGTNVRFAVADLDRLAVSHYASSPCSAFGSFTAAAEAYLAGLRERPQAAAIAVAGPVTDGRVRLTNSAWTFTRAEVQAATGIDDVLLVNDFEALALSLPHLGQDDLRAIGGAAPLDRGTKAVLGPGTGLGVAGLVWSGRDWLAVAGEGGHVSLASESADEAAILERLRARHGHVSAERILSGPGLAELYAVLAAIQGHRPEPLSAADVVRRAHDGQHGVATEALRRFVTWLGRFAGDAALFFGARGGVYLAGGIAPRILEALVDGRFRAAFEAKGRMAAFLAPIPVYVVLAADAGLRGAAAALRRRIARGGD